MDKFKKKMTICQVRLDDLSENTGEIGLSVRRQRFDDDYLSACCPVNPLTVDNVALVFPKFLNLPSNFPICAIGLTNRSHVKMMASTI